MLLTGNRALLVEKTTVDGVSWWDLPLFHISQLPPDFGSVAVNLQLLEMKLEAD